MLAHTRGHAPVQKQEPQDAESPQGETPTQSRGSLWAGMAQGSLGNQALLDQLHLGAAAGHGDRRAAARAGVAGPAQTVPHQAAMDSAFGEPAGGIRAHTDPAARAAARALGVEAFAMGDDVVFGGQKPSPGVVAHEVAHVVQQRAAGNPGQPQGKGDEGALEVEADRAAGLALAGQTGLSAILTPATPGMVQGFNQSSGSTDGSGFSTESGSIEGSQVEDTTIPAAEYEEPATPGQQTRDPVQEYWDQIPYYDEQTKKEVENAHDVVEALEGFAKDVGEAAGVPGAGGGTGEGAQAGLGAPAAPISIPISTTRTLGKNFKFVTVDSITVKTALKLAPKGSNAPVESGVGGGDTTKGGKTRSGPSASVKAAAQKEFESWGDKEANNLSLKGEVEGEGGTGGLGLNLGLVFGDEHVQVKCPFKLVNWEPKNPDDPPDGSNFEFLTLEPEVNVALDVKKSLGDYDLTWSGVGLSLKLTPAYSEVVKQFMLRTFGSAALLTTAMLLGGFYTLVAAYKNISSIVDPDGAKREADAITQDGVNGFIDGLFGHSSGGGMSRNASFLQDANEAGWAARQKAIDLFSEDPALDYYDTSTMIGRLDATLMERIDQYKSAARAALQPKARRLAWDAWLSENRGEPVSSKQAVAAGIFGNPVPPDVWKEASETPGIFD